LNTFNDNWEVARFFGPPCIVVSVLCRARKQEELEVISAISARHCRNVACCCAVCC